MLYDQVHRILCTCVNRRQTGAKRFIDEGLRRDGEEKDRLIREVEDWLEERDAF